MLVLPVSVGQFKRTQLWLAAATLTVRRCHTGSTCIYWYAMH